ncbi:MAG: hypothetical protein AB8E15_01860 [Bdellovibrionales bacterium]
MKLPNLTPSTCNLEAYVQLKTEEFHREIENKAKKSPVDKNDGFNFSFINPKSFFKKKKNLH